jgi:hypothetical protein
MRFILTIQSPTVQFADSLDKEERVEAIAHELVHLLSVYRRGLGVIGRNFPRTGESGDLFKFFMNMRGDWVYLLGQSANTTHPLILINYLKRKYGPGTILGICKGRDHKKAKYCSTSHLLIEYRYRSDPTATGAVDFDGKDDNLEAEGPVQLIQVRQIF